MPQSAVFSLRRIPLILSAAVFGSPLASAQKITVHADKVERPIGWLIYGAGV